MYVLILMFTLSLQFMPIASMFVVGSFGILLLISCNTPLTKIQTRFFLEYIRVFLRVYTRTYPSTDDTTLYTYFETQTISYPDSASCVGIETEPTMLISDQHESGLFRVVCIGQITVMYPYVHVCTLFSLTRLSRLKPQCFLDPKDTLRS